MKNNYLIYGSSRSGKSTLARMMCTRFNISYIPIDKLVTAFEKGLPEIGINHEKKTSENVTNFERFLIPYLKTISHLSRYQDNPIYVVAEGAYLHLEDYVTQLSKSFKIIILVQDTDANTIFENIRKNDCKLDWTYSLNDKELLSYCKHLVKVNKYIITLCRKMGFSYYDTHQNRVEIFDEILKEIAKEEL